MRIDVKRTNADHLRQQNNFWRENWEKKENSKSQQKFFDVAASGWIISESTAEKNCYCRWGLLKAKKEEIVNRMKMNISDTFFSAFRRFSVYGLRNFLLVFTSSTNMPTKIQQIIARNNNLRGIKVCYYRARDTVNSWARNCFTVCLFKVKV